MTLSDDILDLIDVGLQSSTEFAVSVGPLDACVRCGLAPLVDAALCPGCRDFLSADTDMDPAAGRRPGCGDPACQTCPPSPPAGWWDGGMDTFPAGDLTSDAPLERLCWAAGCTNPVSIRSVLAGRPAEGEARYRWPWCQLHAPVDDAPILLPTTMGVSWQTSVGDLVTLNGTRYVVVDIRREANGITYLVEPTDG